MIVEQLYTKCLAEAAYYIESNGEAAIIDPLRETQPYLDIANNNGAKIKYIFETHFHADFVSGHLDLAKKTGATIVYGPKANPAYDVIEATDGQECRRAGKQRQRDRQRRQMRIQSELRITSRRRARQLEGTTNRQSRCRPPATGSRAPARECSQALPAVR